jgi:hypothetical protein
MASTHSRRTAINNNQCIVRTLNFSKKVRGQTIGFVLGHVGIHIKYIDYLTGVHGAKYNRTLPSGVISQ